MPKVCKRDAAAKTRVVVIGGGSGGHVAVEALREFGYTGNITLVSREPHLPIDRTKLSKSLNVALDSLLLRPRSFFDELGVDLLLGTSATAIDTTAKSVTLENGASLNYDHLILSPGGTPRTLPIPGSDLSGIHTLRAHHDSSEISTAIQSIKSSKGPGYKPKMVIVGSSFIGMEMAATAAETCEVTVIGMEKVPFEHVLGTKIGEAFLKAHEKAGVKFRLESSTERFEASKEDGGKIGAVVVKGTGEVIPADLVVLGVGVMCATGFLKSSGIPLERDGSVIVDGRMKVTDSIYAIGDIARYPYHLTGDSVRIEHWSVAQNQARVAAQNISSIVAGGPGDAKFEHVPYFWSAQYGKSLRYAGHAHSFDDVVLRGGNFEEGFEAYFVKGDKVLAVSSLARDPVTSKAAELMRLGLMPSAKEIRDGVDLRGIELGGSLDEHGPILLSRI